MMTTVICSGQNSPPSSSATNYYFIQAGGGVAWGTSEIQRSSNVSAAVVLTHFRMLLGTAPGAGTSWTFNIRKNGSAVGQMSMTISGTATSGTDLVTNLSLNANDTLAIEAIPSGTPASPVSMNWTVNAYGTNSFIMSALSTSLNGTGTQYFGFQNDSTLGTTEVSRAAPMPTPGVVKNLYVSLDGGVGASGTNTFTIYKNGVAQSLKVQVLANNASGSDTSNSITYAAGDTISIESTITGTPVGRRPRICVDFLPTTNGESVLLMSPINAMINSAARFNTSPGGTNTWTSGEVSRQYMVGACTVKKLYALVSAAPGGATSYTFRVRLNLSTTPVVTTITGAATTGNDTTHTQALVDGDLICYSATPASTPTVSSPAMGVVLFIAPIAAGTTAATYSSDTIGCPAPSNPAAYVFA